MTPCGLQFFNQKYTYLYQLNTYFHSGGFFTYLQASLILCFLYLWPQFSNHLQISPFSDLSVPAHLFKNQQNRLLGQQLTMATSVFYNSQHYLAFLKYNGDFRYSNLLTCQSRIKKQHAASMFFSLFELSDSMAFRKFPEVMSLKMGG